MVAINVAIVLFIASIISSTFDYVLGINEGIMVYDWRTETFQYKPTRYDLVLQTMLRGRKK